MNWLLTRHSLGEPVVAASAGRFGVAIAYAAAVLTIEATVFVPSSIDAAVVDSLRAYGATVEIVGRDLDQAVMEARVFAAEVGAKFAPFDATEVLAGYGCVGLELSTQVHGLDTVIVPAGGLVPGLAAWFGETKVVAVHLGEAAPHPTLDGDALLVQVGVTQSEAVWAMGELGEWGIHVTPADALPYAALMGERYEPGPSERVALVIPGSA